MHQCQIPDETVLFLPGLGEAEERMRKKERQMERFLNGQNSEM